MRTWDVTKNCVVVQGYKPEQTALQFGPVIERLVYDAREEQKNNAINLASGKLVNLPEAFSAEEWPVEKQAQWCADNDVDLLCILNVQGWLVPEGLKLAALRNEQWDNATQENLRSALASLAPGKATSPGGSLTTVAEVVEARGTTYFKILVPPATFAFQTRAGGLGVLQVLRYAENPFGMRIRYKLVQPRVAKLTGPIRAATPSVSEVPVYRPVLRDVTDCEDFTGHTEASQTVDVRSRVSGELVKVAFAGGAKVKQSEVLFEIDPRRYQAELEKSEADMVHNMPPPNWNERRSWQNRGPSPRTTWSRPRARGKRPRPSFWQRKPT
jgi:hypothetical protein